MLLPFLQDEISWGEIIIIFTNGKYRVLQSILIRFQIESKLFHSLTDSIDRIEINKKYRPSSVEKLEQSTIEINI